MSIVLLSGGLDSAVALAWAKVETEAPPFLVSIQYGQRHCRERDSARALAEFYGLEYPVDVHLGSAFAAIGGTSLLGIAGTGNPSAASSTGQTDYPPTFVPGRNAIFLAIACSIAYVRQDPDIVGGWNAVDYSGYPDCRPEFLRAMHSAMLAALVPARLAIHSPLLHLSKAHIIELGQSLGVPFELTWSCYTGGQTPCGVCDSCRIRADGFAARGIEDPALRGRNR